MAYTKYSLTPADNNAAPPNGAPEGMLPSAVNDTMRDMMAQIRDVGDGIRGGTYTMTAPVITGGTITGATVTSNTFSSSGATITGGSINGTTIGATTASTGAFSTLSATGVTTVQAGTVSDPAITTTGDTNTGIFFSAADTIDFAEGGVATGQFDSSGNFKFNSGYGSVATAYGCRAWVNFDGTGTPAIRASGNVTSITDNGTGDYTVNFTNAMPDANYCYTMAVEDASIVLVNTNFTSFSKTTSSIRTGTRYISSLTGSGIADDADGICIAIFR
jgi:hypothetical protein